MTTSIVSPDSGRRPEEAPFRSGPPHSALSRAKAVRLFGSDGLREALADGAWVELWAGVVVPGRRVHDPLTRAAAALLRAGPCSVLSGPTAVAMHGCSAAAGSSIHVTMPYDRQLRSRPGLVMHQGRIRESDVVELDGLRVYALDIALAELLCTGPRTMALACLKQALAELDADGAERLRELLTERVSRRVDRRGTRRADAVLELVRDSRNSRSGSLPDRAPTPQGATRTPVQQPFEQASGRARLWSVLAAGAGA
ncbi:hypothetical protein [Haloactinomyces albus]|uniref:Transcriptional regulator, AbiEi antitoxin, Type IV TA system n=1 Tax=Haloactinomyces albus TaxID=1352928 RepID=A0AAE4CMW3_9ACTN|nr:hypothetical protein [Haloactinomyces albus]MDR7301347.1 hypothetical protein [Haloactinomyces albus]